MPPAVNRTVVDLSNYSDLVVIYFGLRIQSPQGILTTLRLGQAIDAALRQRPDGLLKHELMLFSLFPFEIGMRQYWRNFEAMEAWSHQKPHHDWWEAFMKHPRGIGLWHEIYTQQHGIEGIYDHLTRPVGMSRFAPTQPPHGKRSSARGRLANIPPKIDEPPMPPESPD